MNPTTKHSITDLDEILARLSPADQERFKRIYLLSKATGRLVLPAPMRGWAEKTFGSIEAVESQTIVKVTNLITLDGAVFNPLRGRRPMPAGDQGDLEAEIESSRGGAFCHPEEQTPEDTFGRVAGRHAITASNVAKSDGLHGVVVFHDHNPLHFSEETIHDAFSVALQWAREAHNVDRDARYFFLIWNCLWKAGASIVHSHMQMTLGKALHYPKVEHWRRNAALYRLAHGSNYFDDLIAIHESLGLTCKQPGARILAHLTPIKEHELLLIGDRPDRAFSDAVYVALDTLVNRLGTRSFNLALYWHPIDAVDEDWTGFPTIVRIVDRGDPYNRTADFGAMELYGISAVSSDPFETARALSASRTA